MSRNINYRAIDVSEDEDPEDYHYTRRRAEILQIIEREGNPQAVNGAALARRYGCSRQNIYHDLDVLAEYVGDHLGDDAKLQTKAAYSRVFRDLLEADDWQATKAAWDVVMDWNDWLGELGEQHREPNRSEVDIDAHHTELAYTVVREGGDDPLPTKGDDSEASEEIDHAALGFTSEPVGVEVTSPGEDGD